MTKVTVVTVALNDLTGLQRTFASLRGQTYRDVQHVIVDGGSTDGSVEWVRQNEAFPDTVLLSESDDGIFDAMNKGADLAGGDLIYFLNSGDCIAADDVLEMVARSYDLERWHWAFGLSQMVDADFVPTRRRSKPGYSWVRRTFWQYALSHQSVFMRTEELRSLGGFDRRYSLTADCDVMTRLGRMYAPTVWPRVVALTLEGGASGASMRATQWEFHRIRVAFLRMGPILSAVDAGWTEILIAKTRARGFIRKLLRACARSRPRAATNPVRRSGS